MRYYIISFSVVKLKRVFTRGGGTEDEGKKVVYNHVVSSGMSGGELRRKIYGTWTAAPAVA